jgi:hypothetical protein
MRAAPWALPFGGSLRFRRIDMILAGYDSKVVWLFMGNAEQKPAGQQLNSAAFSENSMLSKTATISAGSSDSVQR